MKNFLLISSFKNVFKLICVNIEMRNVENYRDFTIKYNYEDILFLAPFSLNYFINENIERHYKNILTFATIKTDIIDNVNNSETLRILMPIPLKILIYSRK